MKYQPPFVPGATPGAPGIFNADPNAGYVNGDPETGIEGSYFAAPAIEHPQRELARLISSSGITPDHTVLEQVAEASARYASKGVGGLGSGSASAHVVGHLGDTVAPKAYFDGMLLLYSPPEPNVGAVTCAAFGLPAKSIVTYLNAALTGGEFAATRPCALRFNGVLDKWVLLPWTAANFPVSVGGSGGGPSGPGAPVAIAQAVSTPNATPVNIVLTATGTVASYAVATAPVHGTVAISGSSAVYTPAGAYSGADAFTFTATGPGGTSLPATIGITVAMAGPPDAYAHSATFTYTGSDQAWTVPAGTTWVRFKVWGGYEDWFDFGNGGNGFVQAEFRAGAGGLFSPGDALRLMVGGPGGQLSGAGTITETVNGAYGFGGNGYNAGSSAGTFTVAGSGLSAVLLPGPTIAEADIANTATTLLVAGGSGGVGYQYNMYNAHALGANQSGSGDQATARGQSAVVGNIVNGGGGLGGGGGGFRGGHCGLQSALRQASGGSNYISSNGYRPDNRAGGNGNLVGPGTGYSYNSRSPVSEVASLTNGDKSKIIIEWN